MRTAGGQTVCASRKEADVLVSVMARLALLGITAALGAGCGGDERGGGGERAGGALGADAAPRELLPDLDQETPRDLHVRLEQGSWRLGFWSAALNVGEGALTVRGRRRSRREPRMTVDQIVRRADGSRRRYRAAGAMRYVRSPDHAHWHYLAFERYELLEPGTAGYQLVARDRKTGFCLGDRYSGERRIDGMPAKPVYRGRCGLRKRGLLSIRRGISVGYGDDYSAFLEGQSLPLDELPPGDYVLVHRVNADGVLRERTLSNNAASVWIALRWRDGRPSVRRLGRCPDSDRCPR
jgi:hypothetical protein